MPTVRTAESRRRLASATDELVALGRLESEMQSLAKDEPRVKWMLRENAEKIKAVQMRIAAALADLEKT
jgi:hypothetical protein